MLLRYYDAITVLLFLVLRWCCVLFLGHVGNNNFSKNLDRSYSKEIGLNKQPPQDLLVLAIECFF